MNENEAMTYVWLKRRFLCWRYEGSTARLNRPAVGLGDEREREKRGNKSHRSSESMEPKQLGCIGTREAYGWVIRSKKRWGSSGPGEA